MAAAALALEEALRPFIGSGIETAVSASPDASHGTLATVTVIPEPGMNRARQAKSAIVPN
ncbi:MAG: hypothetical protein ACREIP_09045 [Alphaproteobacteria bacterium]